MAHRIDQVRIDSAQALKAAIAAASARLTIIETTVASMTAAQKNVAIADMARYLGKLIKLLA